MYDDEPKYKITFGGRASWAILITYAFFVSYFVIDVVNQF